MPFSSGTFSPLVNFVTASASPPVTAATLDSQFTDMATGLSTCLLKDGTSLPTAAIPFNTQDITGVKSLTAQRVVVNGATVPANGIYLAAANTLAFASNTTLRASVNSTGNWTVVAPSSGVAMALGGSMTIAAPASGTALVVNAVAAARSLQLKPADSASIGMEILDPGGTVLRLNTTATVARFQNALAAGTVALNVNNGDALSIIAAGNVTLAAPASSFHTIATVATDKQGLQITDGVNYTGFIGRSTLFTNAYWMGAAAGNTLVLGGGAREAITVGTTGATAVLAPSSGTALTVTGVAAAAALVVNGSASTPAFSIGNSSTAFTLDCSKSNVQYVTMTGNVAAGSLTISNIQDGQSVNLYLTQDGTGTRTLGNPTGVKWPGGTVGVLSTAAGSLDCITFQRANGITTATIIKAFA